jgi:hypothetical protein
MAEPATFRSSLSRAKTSPLRREQSYSTHFFFGLQEEFFRILQQIAMIVALHDLPVIGHFSFGWLSLALCAVLRPIIKQIHRFMRFFRSESISQFYCSRNIAP